MTATQSEFLALVDLIVGIVGDVFEMMDSWQIYSGFTVYHAFLGSTFVIISMNFKNRLTAPKV